MVDVHELLENDNITDDEKTTLRGMVETTASMEAVLVNIVKRECDEEEFLNESVMMDEIDSYPGDEEECDLLNCRIQL